MREYFTYKNKYYLVNENIYWATIIDLTHNFKKIIVSDHLRNSIVLRDDITCHIII